MKELKRICPVCGKNIFHKSERSLYESKRTNYPCQSCGAKNRIIEHGNNSEFLKFTQKGFCLGTKNPFFGKKHTEETKNRLKLINKDYTKTLKYRDKQSLNARGNKNPMYGKSFYDIWLQKYGLEEANLRMEKFKQKQSLNSSGVNNPMYGKPSPQGSGNGWSGWYKGFYFRSLKELSYIYSLDDQNIKWSSAEHLKIKYLDNLGREKNYLPDFIVGNKIIEIKPFKLRSSRIVRAKEEAALKYCLENNLQYEIIDPPQIDNELLKNLILNNVVKLTDRYYKKFKQLYNL